MVSQLYLCALFPQAIATPTASEPLPTERLGTTRTIQASMLTVLGVP